MKLSANQVDKIDPALKKALEQAGEGDSLRTVMVLGKEIVAKHVIHPSQFPDRVAYRKALIATQQDSHAKQLSNIKQELTDRDLSIKGGNISRAVVVEGLAGAILSSLDLPDVQHASLDQSLSIDIDGE